MKKMENHIEQKEYTMSAGKANALSLFLFIPLALLSWIPYFLIWGKSFFKPEYAKPFLFGLNICTVAFLVSIVLHELIHGFCWSLFARNGWKSIHFGVVWKYLLPYCHCREPLTAKQYRIGLLMPTILLGVFPVIYGLITGSFYAIFYGSLMLLAGGGDLLVFLMMRHLDNETCVKDHPSKIGFIVE